MISNIKKIYKKYTSTDLRLKLKYLKKITKINFYPNYFHKKGIQSIWTKIIFYFLHREFSKKDYLVKKKLLFNNKIDENKIKLILSFPRSGSVFLTNILNSYYEIKNNTGDGVGKYFSNSDSIKYNIEGEKAPFSLFGLVYKKIETPYYRNIDQIDKNINYDRFYLSHYPVSHLDLIYLKKINKITFLIRNPEECCSSYILHILNFDNHLKKKTNINLDDEILLNKYLNRVTNDYKLFIKFITSINNKLVIKYNELNENTFNIVENIFKYFNEVIDKDILLKAIEINKKREVERKIKLNLEFSNRISNKDDLDYIKKKVSNDLTKILRKELKIYKEL